MLRQVGEVVVESGVDDAISRRCADPEAVQVVEVAAEHLRPGTGKRLGARIRTAEPDHMVARLNEFRNEMRTDEAGGACQKHSHLGTPGKLASTAQPLANGFYPDALAWTKSNRNGRPVIRNVVRLSRAGCGKRQVRTAGKRGFGVSGSSCSRRCTAQYSNAARDSSGGVATSGVDAPMREIAEQAGVGVGTIYRHFPKRADLIVAVIRHEIDAALARHRLWPPSMSLARH